MPPKDAFLAREAFTRPPPVGMPSSMMPPLSSGLSQQTSSVHDKLLEDQQKMISMYQQALQQILDFRGNYFKDALDMQMNLMKEREQMLNTQ